MNTATYLTIAGYLGAVALSGVAAYLLFAGGESGAASTAKVPAVDCGVSPAPGFVCAGRF